MADQDPPVSPVLSAADIRKAIKINALLDVADEKGPDAAAYKEAARRLAGKYRHGDAMSRLADGSGERD